MNTIACGKDTPRSESVVGGLRDITECFNTTSQFGDSILKKDYQAAYNLTSARFRETTTLQEFIESDRLMREKNGDPMYWGPAPASAGSAKRVTALHFGSALAMDGRILPLYRIEATVQPVENGCALADLRFSFEYRDEPQPYLEEYGFYM